MVKTIKKRQGILGVLKVPGTPRSGKTPNFSIFTFKCGKVVFSTPFPKMPSFWNFFDFRGCRGPSKHQVFLVVSWWFWPWGRKGPTLIKMGWIYWNFNKIRGISLNFINFMKWGDLGGFCGFLNSGPPGGGPPFGPLLPPPHFRPGHQNRKSLLKSRSYLNSGRQEIPARGSWAKRSQKWEILGKRLWILNVPSVSRYGS